jgi:hypothetical protein
MAKDETNPISALQEAICRALFFSNTKHLKSPGQIILSLPPKTREALQKLTSAELSKYRVDYIP